MSIDIVRGIILQPLDEILCIGCKTMKKNFICRSEIISSRWKRASYITVYSVLPCELKCLQLHVYSSKCGLGATEGDLMQWLLGGG